MPEYILIFVKFQLIWYKYSDLIYYNINLSHRVVENAYRTIKHASLISSTGKCS